MARNLNDTQRLILSAAAARDDLRALPLPETLRAPAHVVKKTVATMIEQGLLGEVTALPDEAVWTESNAGGRVTLVATPAGLAAIGVGHEAAPATALPDNRPTSGKGRGGGTKPTPSATSGSTGLNGRSWCEDEKARPRARAATPTGWGIRSGNDSCHRLAAATVRGFMSGALKKRLGLEVTSEKGEDGERRYFAGPEAEQK